MWTYELHLTIGHHLPQAVLICMVLLRAPSRFPLAQARARWPR